MRHNRQHGPGQSVCKVKRFCNTRLDEGRGGKVCTPGGVSTLTGAAGGTGGRENRLSPGNTVNGVSGGLAGQEVESHGENEINRQ